MPLCSIAIVVGVIGAVALVKRLVWRRRFGHGGYGRFAMAGCGPSCAGDGGCGSGGGPGEGAGPCGGAGGWRRGWRGGFGGHARGIGKSFWLRALFSKLDTTPGQEKEIRSALEDLQKAARESKDSLGASREAVARAVRHEGFDEIAIGEATVKADAAAGQVKQAFEAALRRIHAVLDGKQRERLAEIVEKGPRGFVGFGGGPYRGHEHD